MPIQQHCVMCAKLLPMPRRVDARYCLTPSTCRVRAFRASQAGGVPPHARQRRLGRRPTAESVPPEVKATTQLAAFRAMRQAQKRTAELVAQLAHAERQSAAQHTVYEQQTQTLNYALQTAQQQLAQLATTLQQTQAQAQVEQVAADAALADCAEGRQRILEQAAWQQAVALEAAGAERAESEGALRVEHLLQLCELRVSACVSAEQAMQEGLAIGRREVQPQLERLTQERDQARRAELSLVQQQAKDRAELEKLQDTLRHAKEVISEHTAGSSRGSVAAKPAAFEVALSGKLAGAAVAPAAAPTPTTPPSTERTAPREPAPQPGWEISRAHRYAKLTGGGSD